MASEHPEREKPDFYHYWMNEHVRFHDMDAYSHVNNNVIGVYFETARMAWLESMHPHGWLTGAQFVLAKNTLHFLQQLNYPNTVRIGKSVLKVGNSSMISCGAIFKGEECVALCESVSVWIGNKSRKAERIPDNIRAALLKK